MSNVVPNEISFEKLPIFRVGRVPGGLDSPAVPRGQETALKGLKEPLPGLRGRLRGEGPPEREGAWAVSSGRSTGTGGRFLKQSACLTFLPPSFAKI